MSTLSLRSIQAVLIISVLDFGSGKLTDFWSMIAICKRIGAQLCLRELVNESRAIPSSTDTSISSASLETHVNTSPEEHIRAYWMIEMLDSMSTLGTTWNLPISTPPGHCAMPCSEAAWEFPEHQSSAWSLGPFQYSSAFSLCIILVASEMSIVHTFLRKRVDLRNSDAALVWQSEAQAIDDRLTSWREEFVASVFRLINARPPQADRSEMDPNIVLTNCVLNMAIIIMFQRLVPLPSGIETDYEPWAYATNRCVYASENMAAKVRRMDDQDLLVGNPHLIPCLFVSARFFIVWSKALSADVPSNLRSLAYALHLSGQRWPLARRYEVIVRTAVSEHRTPVQDSSLPRQFFDLRYSAIDIDETLQQWARERENDGGLI
ncbi:hypothetical protein BX600DRAFT_515185 [Xylariales sp. PMI_506]|nr:hypothetical protein BX600DRAFT_515185 [Xylariales sp. PMI_506]